jgi:hypothetical protein
MYICTNRKLVADLQVTLPGFVARRFIQLFEERQGRVCNGPQKYCSTSSPTRIFPQHSSLIPNTAETRSQNIPTVNQEAVRTSARTGSNDGFNFCGDKLQNSSIRQLKCCHIALNRIALPYTYDKINKTSNT